MLVKTFCAAVNGLEVTTVTVEVSITRGVLFHLTGLGDTAVKESRDRVAAAMLNNGFKFPVADITINLSPADIKKEGSSYDLPVAIGIIASDGKMLTDRLKDYMLVGELGLDGTLRPVRGALPIAIQARKEKFKGLIVPRQNEREAAVVNNLDVYGMESLLDVINFLNGETQPEPCRVDTRKEFYEQQYTHDLDFADVKSIMQNAGSALMGIGEASGIFPVDGRDYNAEYIAKTESLLSAKGFDKKLRDVFPAVSMAGEKGAFLTEAVRYAKGEGVVDDTLVFAVPDTAV